MITNTDIWVIIGLVLFVGFWVFSKPKFFEYNKKELVIINKKIRFDSMKESNYEPWFSFWLFLLECIISPFTASYSKARREKDLYEYKISHNNKIVSVFSEKVFKENETVTVGVSTYKIFFLINYYEFHIL